MQGFDQNQTTSQIERSKGLARNFFLKTGEQIFPRRVPNGISTKRGPNKFGWKGASLKYKDAGNVKQGEEKDIEKQDVRFGIINGGPSGILKIIENSLDGFSLSDQGIVAESGLGQAHAN